MKPFLTILFSWVVFLAAGCQTPRINPAVGGRGTPIDETLVPGDVLRITFAGAPDLNQTHKIQPDGRVTLPQIGEVGAAGKTPRALQNQLVQLYKSKLQNTEVTVAVESTTFAIYVSGAVNKAGKIVLDRPLTVLEAIMEAGGFARGLADTKHVRIIRELNGKHQTTVLDLTPAIQGLPTNAVYVQRYDVIYVPETWL